MKYYFKKYSIIILSLIFYINQSITVIATPRNFHSQKYAAIVVDVNTGKILFQKNSTIKRYPASLTKMMTLYLVFEALKEKRTNINRKMKVSVKASKQPPTKLGLTTKQTITVKDAILGLIVRSANDAAIVLAEHIGVNEQRFVKMMNVKAKTLGMHKTKFTNPSGLPDLKQYTTAEDMSILAIALKRDFPEYYYLFSTKTFNYRGKTIYNHNKLLDNVRGVDGLKTGYINMSGYNIASSIKLANKNVVAVVMGGNKASSRDQYMQFLLKKYLPMASNKIPFNKNEFNSAIPKKSATIPIPVLSKNRQNFIDKHNKPTVQIAKNKTALIVPTINPQRTKQIVIPKNRPIQSDWAIQIGSLPTKEAANTLLKKIINDTNNLLVNNIPEVSTYIKNRKTFYRARFLGFNTRNQAIKACSIIKTKKYACYSIRMNSP
ncbi:D-alanyl-D-alanine carboxypeptidase [Bartonella sp. DGB1]|uniref:D-alanyl-D-alanine carboxypeptidase n=1 Tax=Bartonella sp. DGB1 TaxID=3239807 RepID=UPI003525EC78